MRGLRFPVTFGDLVVQKKKINALFPCQFAHGFVVFDPGEQLLVTQALGANDDRAQVHALPYIAAA